MSIVTLFWNQPRESPVCHSMGIWPKRLLTSWWPERKRQRRSQSLNIPSKWCPQYLDFLSLGHNFQEFHQFPMAAQSTKLLTRVSSISSELQTVVKGCKDLPIERLYEVITGFRSHHWVWLLNWKCGVRRVGRGGVERVKCVRNSKTGSEWALPWLGSYRPQTLVEKEQEAHSVLTSALCRKYFYCPIAIFLYSFLAVPCLTFCLPPHDNPISYALLSTQPWGHTALRCLFHQRSHEPLQLPVDAFSPSISVSRCLQ